jgi:hypothetical protein
LSPLAHGADKRHQEFSNYRSLNLNFKVSHGEILNTSMEGREEVGNKTDIRCQEPMNSALNSSLGVPPQLMPVFTNTPSKAEISNNKKELQTTGYLRTGGYCRWGEDFTTTSYFEMKMPFDNQVIKFDFIFFPKENQKKTTVHVSNAYVMVYPNFYIIPSCTVTQEWTNDQIGKVSCTLKKTYDYDHSVKALMNYAYLYIYIETPKMNIAPDTQYEITLNFEQ